MKYLDLLFDRPLEGSFTYLALDNSPMFGKRVYAVFGKKKLMGYVVRESSVAPDLPAHVELRTIEGSIDTEPVFNNDLVELAQWMARFYICSFGEALASMIPGGKRNTVFSFPDVSEEDPPAALCMNSEQTAALKAITARRAGNFYLYGITGSGKTEVFLRAAEKTLEEGRGVIYLVPEIALTHQLVDGIRARFSTQVAVLHSGLSPSQRIAQWKRILSSEATLVIGARSAIFAPLSSIGLIIIDEEHESSYKSGSTPRYHARQVAMFRAKKHGARLVMGSATPSVEAWYHRERGTLQDLRLGQRFFGATLPQLSIVNIRGSTGSLSDTLVTEMRSTLKQGKQVLLFLNRRGFGYFYHCRSCGADFSCARCSVSLTFHKSLQRLLCHHCGYHRPAPQSCPECGSLDLGFSGFGTEKVEEDIRSRLPLFTLARLDADSVKKKGELEKRMKDFRLGNIDILLGTQMVAKGLNFPGVALVGVILADSSLHLPDFRSFEKTFSLITQVAGRSGRFSSGGKVIIQTFNPQHHVIRHAAAHDLEGFYKRELAQRQELHFPPYSRISRILVRGKNRDKVWSLAKELVQKLEAASELKKVSSEILGPAECPISVIHNNYRVHTVIISEQIEYMKRAISRILKSTKVATGLYIEIDIDPQSML